MEYWSVPYRYLDPDHVLHNVTIAIHAADFYVRNSDIYRAIRASDLPRPDNLFYKGKYIEDDNTLFFIDDDTLLMGVVRHAPVISHYQTGGRRKRSKSSRRKYRSKSRSRRLKSGSSIKRKSRR